MTMDWKPEPAKSGPREERKSRLLPIEVGSERMDRTRVVVRNLSPYGLGVRGDIQLLACERVTVYLPGGFEVGATVRWVRNGTFGLALDEAINPAVLQPKAATGPSTLKPKGESDEFQLMKVRTDTRRPGFIRSRRDDILNGHSHWTND
jgi:hypothetical protein